MMNAHSPGDSAPAIHIHANGTHYRDLNSRIREAVDQGAKRIELRDVHGQRYIGTNLQVAADIHIHGTPGNDLGAFMNGSRITVYGNAQDGTGNTMNEGEIIIHGHAGDITGLSARGGTIFVRDGVGYRAGIHMKEYGEKKPALVIGGTAQDFLGEYMAGGIVVVLGIGLADHEPHRASFVGTGMHGGVIYLRGRINDYQLGKEVGVSEPTKKDREVLSNLIRQFATHFDHDADEMLCGRFLKLTPLYLRPYGKLYAY